LNSNLRRRLAIGFALGFVVFIGLLLYGDISEIGRLLQNFRWSLLPTILGLTMVNYILRGVRFHYYLHQIGIKNIAFWPSFLVFLGGFALTVTPGKVGELIRVLWLKKLVDADPAQAAPSTIVDRIVDGLAMAILASLGALVYPRYWPVVALLLGIIIGGVIISQIRPLAFWLLNAGEKAPFVSKFVHHLHALYESTYQLLRFKNLLVGTAIGFVSWSAEGIACYLILIGLGIPPSFNLALVSIFVLSLGSILGGMSSLPGGLGAAAATITGTLQVLINLTEDVAATATLLIRFCTLWFAVALGLLVIAIWRKKLFGNGAEELDLSSAAIGINSGEETDLVEV
jgi:uncharacterized membrane protein YbhN (UPF0104 family)